MDSLALSPSSIVPLRILLVDDHEKVRKQIRTRLSREPDLEIVAEAISGTDAAEQALSLQPEIVIIDPAMRDGLGLEAVRQVFAGAPGAAILVLSACLDTASRIELRQAGVCRFVNKELQSTALVANLREMGQELRSYPVPLL